MTGIDSCSGIARLLGIVPIGLVAGKFQIDLPRLQFGFLQADEICVQAHKDIGEALPRHGPEAIYIPGDEFHTL